MRPPFSSLLSALCSLKIWRCRSTKVGKEKPPQTGQREGAKKEGSRRHARSGEREAEKKKKTVLSLPIPRAACPRRLSAKYSPTRRASGGPGERIGPSRSASPGWLAPLFWLFYFFISVEVELFFFFFTVSEEEIEKGKAKLFTLLPLTILD